MEYIYNSPVVKIQKNNTHSFTIHSSSNNYFKKSLEVLNIHSENDDVSTKINIQLEVFHIYINRVKLKISKKLRTFLKTININKMIKIKIMKNKIY